MPFQLPAADAGRPQASPLPPGVYLAGTARWEGGVWRRPGPGGSGEETGESPEGGLETVDVHLEIQLPQRFEGRSVRHRYFLDERGAWALAALLRTLLSEAQLPLLDETYPDATVLCGAIGEALGYQFVLVELVARVGNDGREYMRVAEMIGAEAGQAAGWPWPDADAEFPPPRRASLRPAPPLRAVSPIPAPVPTPARLVPAPLPPGYPAAQPPAALAYPPAAPGYSPAASGYPPGGYPAPYLPATPGYPPPGQPGYPPGGYPPAAYPPTPARPVPDVPPAPPAAPPAGRKRRWWGG